jgi:polar amino acid transport system substrate-binding protein
MAKSSKTIQIAAVAIIAVVAIAAIGIVLMGGLGADDRSALEKIKDRGKLIVGTSAGFPPFEMLNTSAAGGVEGIDMDVAKAIADSLGVELEIKNYDDFSVLITALQNGKIDMVIAGMTITDDRNESAAFSMPYYKADQALVVLKSNSEITNTTGLVGKTVAVNTGTTGQYYIEDNLPNIKEMKPFGTASDTFQALGGNKVDAIIIDSPVAANYISDSNPYKIVETIETNEFYGIAMSKNNAEDLVAEVNKIVGDMIESGEMDDIISKWSRA